MFRNLFFSFLTCLGTCACSSWALAEEPTAQLLPPGRYVCATVTTDAQLDVQEVVIKHEGEQITAVMHDGSVQMSGKLVGARLYLIRQEIDDIGLEVVQVVGLVQVDGTAHGTGTRTLDGKVIERGAFTLRRISQ